MYDAPYMSYMALYIISMQLIQTSSRTSNHWKLNLESGKVLSVSSFDSVGDGDADSDNQIESVPEDHLFDILTSRVQLDDGNWKLEREINSCADNCKKTISNTTLHIATPTPALNDTSDSETRARGNSSGSNNSSSVGANANVSGACRGDKGCGERSRMVDCGKPVNYTSYDHLRGVLHRNSHPPAPEPDVARHFRKKNVRGSKVDMAELEQRLKRAKSQHPKSSQVHNQIGNFHRIRGDTRLSIDCFRKSLSLSPGNAEALLSLARVLLHLRYLDDALLLTRRSLEAAGRGSGGASRPGGGAWLQHFTLGEILAARGERHEASLHLRHSLDLNPGFAPAIAQLREMRGPAAAAADTPVTRYTLFIILLLALGVLCGILTSVDGLSGSAGAADDLTTADGKTQRHFNRAMAMRSIKLGINPRLIRTRKQATYM